MASINLRKTILKMHSQGYKVTLISSQSRHAQFNCLEHYQKILNTKEVADLPRTDRPKCMRTPKKIKAIRERIKKLKKIDEKNGIRSWD